ncbi:hypothetical protein VR41_12080 [Streptomyces sp. NRRL B-1568]|nr:hypothetical protein VR41_12080 [Streptomyces sp. NRRL B-1568]
MGAVPHGIGRVVSEFQYYHFVAIDRLLDREQLAEIRQLTTRASLTPTSFVNTYQWGDFKGSPETLVEHYYDGHLYFANWGTRRVILRWPVDQLPLEVAERYCTGASATARRHGERNAPRSRCRTGSSTRRTRRAS